MSAYFVEHARRLLAGRDLEGALDACGRAVAEPDATPEAWFMKGTVELALARPGDAAQSAREALRRAPRDPRYWALLGNASHDGSRLDEARAAYTQAAEIAPGWAVAWHRLGTVHFDLGDTPAAAAAFTRAVEADAGYVRSWNNLGHAHLELGRLDDAEAALRRALALQPDYAHAFYNLARIARARGDAARASDYALLAHRLEPGLADAGLLAAEMQRRRGDTAGAIARLEALASAQPNHTGVRTQLGELLWESGEAERARETYAQAARARPTSLRAALGEALVLPPVYASLDALHESRERYARGLAELSARAHDFRANNPEALARDAQWSNFYLAYQGGDDAALQRTYGGFIAEVLEAAFPAFYAPRARRARAGRPRVGFFSHFFFNCTAGRYFKSWITDLDRERFESFVYYTNEWVGDDTREIAAACDHFRHGAGMPLAQLARVVADDALDVLVFPELGMHGPTFALASMRLAPVQACGWGHPVTPGHPNIDHFLSAGVMERDDAQADYNERLERLPGLGTRYAVPATAPPADPATLGLPADRNLYLVPQSLFKIHPDNDALMAGVLEADPRAHLVFFEVRQPAALATFRARMRRAHPSFDARSTFLPYMPHASFLQVNASCHVMLDTLHWSGGNTSLDALASGLPLVTSPGRFMRGRQSAGMLGILGLEELVVPPADFVAKAVSIGADRAEHARLRGAILARGGALFERREPIDALHAFLARVTS